MSEQIISELAPNGTLRAGINLGNILLVTGLAPNGDPTGVAPSMGAAIADRLGVKVAYVLFDSPGQLVDAASTGTWDIGLVADDPVRAREITFTRAYVEIEATYLVPASSSIQSIEDVDSDGVKVAVSDRSAYDLYLSRALNCAKLHRGPGLKGAFELYVAEKLDALAGLRPALDENARQIGNARVLNGRFLTVQQAIGTHKANVAAAAFLQAFVAEASNSGLVARLIDQYGVTGKLQAA